MAKSASAVMESAPTKVEAIFLVARPGYQALLPGGVPIEFGMMPVLKVSDPMMIESLRYIAKTDPELREISEMPSEKEISRASRSEISEEARFQAFSDIWADYGGE